MPVIFRNVDKRLTLRVIFSMARCARASKTLEERGLREGRNQRNQLPRPKSTVCESGKKTTEVKGMPQLQREREKEKLQSPAKIGAKIGAITLSIETNKNARAI